MEQQSYTIAILVWS